MGLQRVGHDLSIEQQQQQQILLGPSYWAKDKNDVGVSDLGLQDWKSKWGWKTKCLLNKCLLGYAGTIGHGEEF